MKYIYCCFYLIGIILFTLLISSVLYRRKEGLTSTDLAAYNDLLGGTILTLQEELSTLNDNLDSITSDLQDIYYETPDVLKSSTTPAGKLYNNILELTPYTNAIINNPIVETPPPLNPDPDKKESNANETSKNAANSDSAIVNTNIKRFPSWNLFRNIIDKTKTPLKLVLDNINEYLAINKTPDDDLVDTIDNIKSQVLLISTIQNYIEQILTVPALENK